MSTPFGKLPATDADLMPPYPELEKFRNNLIKGMVAKNMSGSDVARAVWGTKTSAQGRSVARNRDRMTHYLRGHGYPRPETVAKLAEILDLDPKDLEREPGKTRSQSQAQSQTTSGPTVAAEPRHAEGLAAARVPQPTPPSAFRFDVKDFGMVHFSYNKTVNMRLAMRLFDAIRAVDPDFNSETPLDPNEAANTADTVSSPED